MNWIQYNIINNFQLLVGTLSPAEALVQLVTTYGVVLDEHSKPVALVTADDLTQAVNQDTSSLLDTKVGYPPTIIVGCQVHMQHLMKWKGFIEQHEKFRGVIVIDDNKVVGILNVTTIRNHLNILKNRDFELRGDQSGAASDSGLSGSHQSPKTAPIKCSVCQCKDEFFYFDYDNPPDCKNPYNFKPHKFNPS